MKELNIKSHLFNILLVFFIFSCRPENHEQTIVERGRNIFFNETFSGNGRTCGTCHRTENNFTIDPAFIATLPDSDALFVAEFTPALSRNFENRRLLREFGLITEDLNGFNNLDSNFNLRGVPHTLGLRLSVNSPSGPHTGWSGDGAPGDGSLRSFATGAVIQHFTKSLNRIVNVDFRLPTDEELDAIEAFMLSLGPQEELHLPLPLKSPAALRGQIIFNDPSVGKCKVCHFNAGANADTAFFKEGGNLNFNTGVEKLPDQPARLSKELVPIDDGFGFPGDSTFNVPSLVEAADTGPFFHNNSVSTIEAAVAFYDGESFANSPAAKQLAKITGSELELDATQIAEIAAFLRVINALENIRQGELLLKAFVGNEKHLNVPFKNLLNQAMAEIHDAVNVLRSGGLHPKAIIFLKDSVIQIENAIEDGRDRALVTKALRDLSNAKEELIELNKSK